MSLIFRTRSVSLDLLHRVRVWPQHTHCCVCRLFYSTCYSEKLAPDALQSSVAGSCQRSNPKHPDPEMGREASPEAETFGNNTLCFLWLRWSGIFHSNYTHGSLNHMAMMPNEGHYIAIFVQRECSCTIVVLLWVTKLSVLVSLRMVGRASK